MRLSPSRLTAAAGAAAAVLASSSPALAADAVFGGVSNSGDAIVLKADSAAKELRSVTVSWNAACNDDKNFPFSATLTPAVPDPGFAVGSTELLMSRNGKGRFDGVQLAARDLGEAVAAIQYTFTGKLKPGQASGTYSAIVKIANKETGDAITSCQTGTVSWVLTRKPGVIFGGATSQGEPIVLRLNPARKRVNDLLTTWKAPCGTGGFWRVADHFVNFPVKSTGRFGNPFTDDATASDGTKRHWDYNVAGRLTKTSGKGTLGVKVTETDSAGTATTCDTGGVTWKATSG